MQPEQIGSRSNLASRTCIHVPIWIRRSLAWGSRQLVLSMVIIRTILVASRSFVNVQKMITDDIRAFLQQRTEVEKRDVGMVVGLVDGHGNSIVTGGSMDG